LSSTVFDKLLQYLNSSKYQLSKHDLQYLGFSKSTTIHAYFQNSNSYVDTFEFTLAFILSAQYTQLEKVQKCVLIFSESSRAEIELGSIFMLFKYGIQIFFWFSQMIVKTFKLMEELRSKEIVPIWTFEDLLLLSPEV